MTQVAPVLVTGSHRSGTTWVGRMLCLSEQLAYVHEPFCPNRSPGWLDRPIPYWYLYISSHNESAYTPSVKRLMHLRYPMTRSLSAARKPKDLARQVPEITKSLPYRVARRSPLIKDPFALFSSEWLADRFGVRPVIMIRKPVAFVSSIKRLNWGFDYEQNWLPQRELIGQHLAAHAQAFENYQGEVDLVGEGIVMWNALYDFVDRLRERRPEFAYVIYEDLAGDPVPGFRRLYERLGLRWDQEVRAQVEDFSGAGNPKDVSARKRRAIKRDSRAATDTWRDRLSPEEAERVTAATAEVAGRFYEL